jgi:hypothetical protein
VPAAAGGVPAAVAAALGGAAITLSRSNPFLPMSADDIFTFLGILLFLL